MNENRTFLGRVWSFPPALDRDSTPTRMTAYEENIQQSLWTLLSTSPGERVHRYDYGCPVRRYMFDLCSDLDCLDLESNEEVGILRIFILLKMMNTPEEFTVKDAMKTPKIVFTPK